MTPKKWSLASDQRSQRTRSQLAADTVLICSACKRQQGDVARKLDRRTQAALMRRADAGQPPWHDLPALGHKLRQQTHIFVVDAVDLFDTELADLLAAEILPAARPTWATFASPSGA